MNSGRIIAWKALKRSKRTQMDDPPKDSHRWYDRPGGKDLLRKKHEAAFISWARRANRLNLR